MNDNRQALFLARLERLGLRYEKSSVSPNLLEGIIEVPGRGSREVMLLSSTEEGNDYILALTKLTSPMLAEQPSETTGAALAILLRNEDDLFCSVRYFGEKSPKGFYGECAWFHHQSPDDDIKSRIYQCASTAIDLEGALAKVVK